MEKQNNLLYYEMRGINYERKTIKNKKRIRKRI